jgi:hypothetical protein
VRSDDKAIGFVENAADGVETLIGHEFLGEKCGARGVVVAVLDGSGVGRA